MEIKDVIQMIKDEKTNNLESFYVLQWQDDDTWADINLTEAYPAFMFRIMQRNKCLFAVKVRKVEALEWLMDGYARQYNYPKWDYETDPINRIDGEWDFL